MAFDRLRKSGFDIEAHSYAGVMFDGVFPDAMSEIEDVLLGLEIRVSNALTAFKQQ
jgi:hypothetical protein